MARHTLSDILQNIAYAPSDEAKVEALQQTNLVPLRQLLLAAYDPAVKFDVEIPEYRENSETDGFASNSLYVEYRRLYLFMDSYKAVTQKRKSDLLAQILETVDPSDAQLLIKVIKKDLSEYGLNAEIVKAAYPGQIKDVIHENEQR